MGGGEFVRAAAKIAGAGAVNAGVRGASTAPQFGQLLRGVSRPASVFVASSSPVPPAKAAAGSEVEAVQKPAWEIDDWEFANWEDGLAVEAAGPKPRIVFGAVPSFEEAKEATTDLKEALDKVYLSSPEFSGSSLIASSNGKLEAESCLAIESQTSVPLHAIQAFRLLKESSEAQTVVASIASDPKVWNAMLANEALQSFLQSYDSYQTNKGLEHHKISEELEDALDLSYAEESRNESRNVFHETLAYIKTSIDDMLSTASSFLHKIFGSSPAEVSGDDKASSGFSTGEIAVGSIMGLAILVALVVFAKRN
ncbi:uncharacterized protein LOC111010375 isoform X2 [Momordica charantia]|uniref:Uncharacterized protein LOC111010375 isoform X2 n=1 Tax=Momordica charantia TaxID=3673 RepID=A0A6J1CDZ4_MOMCH|nr:uncharacterized protein LOC111010375 isoform X2 [Momordica charantia]